MTASIAIALASALLVFVVAAVAGGALAGRRDRLACALDALRSLRWQDFAHHVSDMLARRGLIRDDLDRHPGADGFDLRVSRGSARYLVQCKHGGAFRLSGDDLKAFRDMIRLQGADGGILVTTGTAEAELQRRATALGVELLAGENLWNELEPLLPEQLIAEVEHCAAERRRRKLVLAAALAVTAGLAAGAFTALRPPAQAPLAVPPVAAPVQSARPAAEPPAATGDESAAALPMPDPTLGAQQLAARRAEAQRAVASIPVVEAAFWSTRSTLTLEVRGRFDDRVIEPLTEAACVELLRYEELRFTRLQLQAAEPDGADQNRIRWRQCR